MTGGKKVPIYEKNFIHHQNVIKKVQRRRSSAFSFRFILRLLASTASPVKTSVSFFKFSHFVETSKNE